MQGQAGRTVLSVLATVAVVLTILSLGATERVTGAPTCPLNCSAHGVCLNGSVCQCDPCYSGEICVTECSDHGVCLNGSICVCDDGFSGLQCELGSTTSTSTTTVSTTSTTTTTLPAITHIGVIPKKLIVIDKLASPGASAKTVYVSKDRTAGITKGAGLSIDGISATFDVRYDDFTTAGSFTIPFGGTDGTSGWVINKAAVAKYVNKAAPSGPTETKVGVIKPDKLLKLVGKGLGDVPLDIFGAGQPAGSVYTAYCVLNGVYYCHCSELTGCVHTPIAAGVGAKLVCKEGLADPTCAALEPESTCPTNGDPPAVCSSEATLVAFCSGSGACATCLNENLNASAPCNLAVCGIDCSDAGANQACGESILLKGCESECCE